jgi:hypothetical protein
VLEETTEPVGGSGGIAHEEETGLNVDIVLAESEQVA